MAQTPTSNSTLLNNAAKDDAVGLNGDFNFTISDLLANDPGGAAKVNIDTHFFFGDSAPLAGGIPTIAAQVLYLDGLGITAHLNDAGTSFVSFDIRPGADDFNYFVQIGNKGTWSTASVDVTAPVPHASATALFAENFDHTPTTQTFLNNGTFVSADINLKGEGWTGTEHTDERGTSSISEVGVSDVLGGIHATSGQFFLDTQNTKGGINISHEFTDSTAALDGKTAVLSFDIGKMNVDWNGSAFATASDAKFEFQIDGHAVKSFTAAELSSTQLTHFDIDIKASDYTGTDDIHTLSLVDTSADAGLLRLRHRHGPDSRLDCLSTKPRGGS